MKSTLTLLFGLLLFSTLHAQVPAYVPTDGLVGWWPFNGNANDESGSGNDGVVNGATLAEDRFGNADGAYSFNGTNNFIEGVFSNFPLGNSSRSISTWIKLPQPNNSFTNFICSWGLGTHIWQSSSNQAFGLFANYPQQIGIWQSFGSSDQDQIFNNADLEQNMFFHLVVTVDIAGEFVYYVNGLPVYSSTIVGMNTIANGNVFRFGRSTHTSTDGWAGYFLGSLDDIAIFNRALTEQEIQNLYAGTTPAACPSLSDNLQTGLVGYWPFCGNANDESGNGNDGVVNGATLTEDRFGNAASAYGFDGVDDIITVPDNSSLDFPGGAFSISAWVKLNVLDYETGFIDHLDNGGPSIFARYEIRILSNNKIRFVLKDMDSNFSYIDSDSLITNTNNWYHVVGTFNSSSQSIKLFINGVDQVGQVTLEGTGPSITPPGVLQFGRYGDASFANSLIDDIAIWNRALTPAEVQELYTLDACTFTVYDTLTVENVINVYDTLTIENIVDIYDTTYINVEVYDTLTVENIINVYDTLTIENVIDVFDTTTVVETVVVFDTLTVENVIDVFDTTTVVETVVVFDTLTVENVIDVYDTTYVTVTDTLIIDIPSGVGGTILNTLLLYPNPTSDQLTISYGNFAAMAGYSLSIFDNGGSAVYETSITQAQETLDITQWSAGVYQVVVYNAGGVPVETRQIVIQ